MARIISSIDKNTGRRVQVARVDGGSSTERNANLAGALGVSKNKASKLSNNDAANALAPGFASLSTASLKPEADFDLKTPPAVAGPGQGSLESTLTALPKKLAEDRVRAEANEQASFDQLFSEGLNTETPSAIRARVEGAAGIQGLKSNAEGTGAVDLANKLTAEQERLRKEVERIQKAPGTATAAERDRAVGEATRVSNRTQADIAITQLAAQGRLDAAQEVADTAVLAETEYHEKRLGLLQMAYERNKDLFTKAEQREFETAQADREREAGLEIYKVKSQFDQKLAQSDPLYQLSLREKQLQIDKLSKPDPTGISAETLERISKLPVGSQEKLVNSTDTIGQLQRMKTLIAENDFATLSNPATEQGRLFQRLSTDVADKLARERTGAVVSKEEQANFKRIMGVGFLTRALAPSEEVNSELDYFINKHENVRKLIDPTGEIVAYLGADTADAYLDAVDEATGANDPLGAYLKQFER